MDGERKEGVPSIGGARYNHSEGRQVSQHSLLWVGGGRRGDVLSSGGRQLREVMCRTIHRPGLEGGERGVSLQHGARYNHSEESHVS